ncbi:hypothetical protein [Bacterioplanoides sp.]|uniref:hypothetical protein n=1 Tax=Bacterioplanoides sp. TaxID=2066072 RepID=UPI003B5A2AE9
MRTSPKLLTTAVLAASLIACGGQDQETQSQQVNINKSPSAGPETGTQTLSFDLNVRSALAAGISASNAKVTITKGDLQRTQNVNLDGDSASVSFNSLPIGEYQVAIQVMDGTTVVAQGSGTANVNADIQSEIDLVLNAVTGNLQVNLCMPDSSIEYQSGSYSGALTMNSGLNEGILTADGKTEDITMLETQLTGKTSLSVDITFGSGTDFMDGIEPDTDAEFNPVLDHGASMLLKADGQVIADVSGCNTEVFYDLTSDELRVMYKITNNHDQPIIARLLNNIIGQIETDGLALMLVFKDDNGDAISAETTNVSDIAVENFETVKMYVGVPRMTATTGLTGLLIGNIMDLVYQGAYVAESEEISLTAE